MSSQKTLTSGIILIVVLGFTVAEMSLREKIYRVSYANNYFAANLHRKLAEVTHGNIFFSPFTVSSVLAMLYRGAAGETAAELKTVLGYERLNNSVVFPAFQFYLAEIIGNLNPKVYTLNFVSAMIVANDFLVLPRYRAEMQNIFQAYIQDGNIAEESAVIVDRMNTWAKIKTKGNIDNLAEQIYPETTLFLASAAYFKADWRIPFDPENTKDHPFYNGGLRSNATDVPMMHAYTFVRHFDYEDEDFTAVELFYEGRQVSMVIYLPNERNGLSKMEEGMTGSRMLHVRRVMHHTKVHLTIPKFKLDVDKSLSRALNDLGVVKVFKPEADLSRMISNGSALSLDDVQHKATIEVNEKGSVASAVTRAVMTKSMPLTLPDPEFKADHPFLFAIFDTRSHMILFMGRVTRF